MQVPDSSKVPGAQAQESVLDDLARDATPPKPPIRIPTQADELASDLGNSYRYARLLEPWLRYVKGIGWIVRRGASWEPDDLGVHVMLVDSVIADIREQAERSTHDDAERWSRWALASQSASRIAAMLKLAENDPRLALRADALDADPLILAVQNGVLDLTKYKYELRTGNERDYCIRAAGVAFDPNARCPHWIRHVEMMTAHENGTPDPELARYMQRWAGYTLTGLVDEQKFAFMFGEGNNGKNVFIETLMGVLGTYAMTGSVKILTGSGQEHETVIADLHTRRLVFIDETPRGRINEARIKQLTGTSRIRARKMRQDSFEFDARFKLWIAGNHKPRVSDTSEGMWRRLDLIPCDAKIPAEQRVKNYAAILVRDEGPGILNWMLEGLRAYREIGLAPPQRVLDATREYREEQQSDFAQFVVETFDVEAPREMWQWHPNPVIHGLYEAWCHDNGVKYIQSMQQLGSELRLAKFEREEAPMRIKTALWTKVTRGWIGPPLREPLPAHLMWQR